MLTETTDEVRVIDVPLLALKDGDLIRRHPESDEDVVWRLVDWRAGDDASVTYKLPGSDDEHTHEFDEAVPWVTVQAPAAGVSR